MGVGEAEERLRVAESKELPQTLVDYGIGMLLYCGFPLSDDLPHVAPTLYVVSLSYLLTTEQSERQRRFRCPDRLPG